MSRPRLVLPLPPSVNQWLRVGRQGRLYTTPEWREWKALAAWEAVRWRRQTAWRPTRGEKVLAEWWVWWPDARRHDSTNLEKIVWDAMEGILYDDDRWVISRCQDFGIDRARPRIEITWWRWEEVTPAWT